MTATRTKKLTVGNNVYPQITNVVTTGGSVAAEFVYSPFGELISSSGPMARQFTSSFRPHIQ